MEVGAGVGVGEEGERRWVGERVEEVKEDEWVDVEDTDL